MVGNEAGGVEETVWVDASSIASGVLESPEGAVVEDVCWLRTDISTSTSGSVTHSVVERACALKLMEAHPSAGGFDTATYLGVPAVPDRSACSVI